MCVITNPIDNSIIFIENRHENVYIVDLNNTSNLIQCLKANENKNEEVVGYGIGDLDMQVWT